MSKKLLSHVAALSFAGALGVLVIPACTIRFGPGSGDGIDDTQADPGGGEEVAGDQDDNGGDSEVPAVEDEEAIAALEEALAIADPYELALTELKTEYTSYALAAMIESQGEDPASLDPTLVQQTIDTYAPIVWEQAQQWIEGLDPAVIELAKISIKEECVDKWDFGCRRKQYCDFNDGKTYATCLVTGCDKGRCSISPRFYRFVEIHQQGVVQLHLRSRQTNHRNQGNLVRSDLWQVRALHAVREASAPRGIRAHGTR